MIEHIILATLFSLYVWQEICHSRERRDLYNRLMARDLRDYTATGGAREPPTVRSPILKAIQKWHGEGKYSNEAGD